jgi:serine protease Do
MSPLRRCNDQIPMVLHAVAGNDRLDLFEWAHGRGSNNGAAAIGSGPLYPVAPEPSKTPSNGEPNIKTGTAFIVAKSGQLITNAHVVKDCKTLAVEQPGVSGLIAANVLAQDRTNDLALIQAATPFPNSSIPKFRQHVRLGEDVFVFGYPLTGIVASSGNFTRGSVTALAGLGDDTGKLQLTAAVQAGNSGGPVLDQTGAVVGVVVAKLDPFVLAKATGSLPDQINFAIKASTAVSFLETNGIEVSDADANAPAMTAPDIADAAKKFTAHV